MKLKNKIAFSRVLFLLYKKLLRPCNSLRMHIINSTEITVGPLVLRGNQFAN